MDQFHDLGEIEETDETDEYTDEEVGAALAEPRPVRFDVREKEAVKRIEQANLYLSLLNHQLFSENSARPEIIEAVEGEIKDFILVRLEILLGVRAPANEVAVTASPFSPVQTEALKAIADRLSQKDARPVQITPQVRPLGASTQPSVIQVNATTRPVPAATPTPKPSPKKGRPPGKKTVVIREPTPEEGNRGSDGTSYAQASGAGRLPMPSSEQMNMMNAVSVTKGVPSSSGGEIGALLSAAIAASQNKNRDVQED